MVEDPKKKNRYGFGIDDTDEQWEQPADQTAGNTISSDRSEEKTSSSGASFFGFDFFDFKEIQNSIKQLLASIFDPSAQQQKESGNVEGFFTGTLSQENSPPAGNGYSFNPTQPGGMVTGKGDESPFFTRIPAKEKEPGLKGDIVEGKPPMQTWDPGIRPTTSSDPSGNPNWQKVRDAIEQEGIEGGRIKGGESNEKQKKDAEAKWSAARKEYDKAYAELYPSTPQPEVDPKLMLALEDARKAQEKAQEAYNNAKLANEHNKEANKEFLASVKDVPQDKRTLEQQKQIEAIEAVEHAEKAQKDTLDKATALYKEQNEKYQRDLDDKKSKMPKTETNITSEQKDKLEAKKRASDKAWDDYRGIDSVKAAYVPDHLKYNDAEYNIARTKTDEALKEYAQETLKGNVDAAKVNPDAIDPAKIRETKEYKDAEPAIDKARMLEAKAEFYEANMAKRKTGAAWLDKDKERTARIKALEAELAAIKASEVRNGHIDNLTKNDAVDKDKSGELKKSGEESQKASKDALDAMGGEEKLAQLRKAREAELEKLRADNQAKYEEYYKANERIKELEKKYGITDPGSHIPSDPIKAKEELDKLKKEAEAAWKEANSKEAALKKRIVAMAEAPQKSQEKTVETKKETENKGSETEKQEPKQKLESKETKSDDKNTASGLQGWIVPSWMKSMKHINDGNTGKLAPATAADGNKKAPQSPTP